MLPGTSRVAHLTEQFHHDRPWFYFDTGYYRAQCLEAGISPPFSAQDAFLQHYLQRGARLGLSPNPLFDEAYYRRRYPDVAREIQMGRWASAFDHYYQIGARLGQSPCWFFDGAFYRTVHPDLTDDSLKRGNFLDSYAHYLLVGVGEQRPGHWIVQAVKTINQHAKLPVTREALAELLASGMDVPALLSPVFDYEWMREKYAWDGTVKPHNFVTHYLAHVRKERLNPSAYFDEAFYLAMQPEVGKAVDLGNFASGYQHFVMYGMNEWRKPFNGFDPLFYHETNMADGNDAAGMSTFTHFLRNRSGKRLAIAPAFADEAIPEPMGKAIYERRCRLNASRLSGLTFAPEGTTPDVSIVIVARDNFEQTANCIVTAACSTKASLEIIVFDNGSSDATLDLARINPAIRMLRAPGNIGFTRAVNQAASIATGRMILLLNNDLEVAPQAIDTALQTLAADPSIGAVGGRIVRMHGRLQEGGSLIWQDGTCLGYARDGDPMDGQVNFVRDVDYCSGCFLALRRDDWNALGGFDEAYAPAYYEETDLCVRIWGNGQRVVYDPRIVVWHFEFGTSSVPEEALTLMRRNKRIFADKHRAFLADCLPAASANIERARLRHLRHPRVLFIEDKCPDPAKGMGFVRSASVVKALQSCGGLVSVVGLHDKVWPTSSPDDEQGRRFELLSNVNTETIGQIFVERAGVYDVLWVSRTHNLQRLAAWRAAHPAFFAGLKIVLDTEAISAARRHAYAKLIGEAADLEALVDEELEYLDGIDRICVVNEQDHALVVGHLARRRLAIPISVLGHALVPQPRLPDFAGTNSVVLVGSFAEPDGPNADGLLWFDREVRPLLAKPEGLKFVIAGSEAARFARQANLLHDYTVLDNPRSMALAYRNARLMIAPTRFAGGVPMKVHEAASYGVPVVMTQLLATQLGWSDPGLGIAAAASEPFAAAIDRLVLDPDAWAYAQAVQIEHVRRECDAGVFADTVKAAALFEGGEKKSCRDSEPQL